MLDIGICVGVVGITLLSGLVIFFRRRKKNTTKLLELYGDTSVNVGKVHRNSSEAGLVRFVCCGRRLEKDKFRAELTGKVCNGRQELNGYTPPELHGERAVAELQGERYIAELEGDEQLQMGRKRARQPESEKS